MNDLDLDFALGAIGANRTRVLIPPGLRERVHAVPLEAASQRGRVPHLTWRSFDMFSAAKLVSAGASWPWSVASSCPPP